MLKNLSYPYRTIVKNTNPKLNIAKAKIQCAEGVSNKRNWKPRGKFWEKSKKFEAYELDSVENDDIIKKELANEYLLSNVDSKIKIPRRPSFDLTSKPDIESEINMPSKRHNPLELVFLQEIIENASAELSGKVSTKLEFTPSIQASFETKLSKEIENKIKNSVSIDHYTVTIDTGLPVSTDLIETWKTDVKNPLDKFLTGKEPGLIVGISGFVLKGFKGGTSTISEKQFKAAVNASLADVDIKNLGVEIDNAAAGWARNVKSKLSLTISQITNANSFYPLWVQVIDFKDLD